ncbi:MAG: hypothetical protein Kow0059_07650 [Candidatus Sumerlaeia bacterium]
MERKNAPIEKHARTSRTETPSARQGKTSPPQRAHALGVSDRLGFREKPRQGNNARIRIGRLRFDAVRFRPSRPPLKPLFFAHPDRFGRTGAEQLGGSAGAPFKRSQDSGDFIRRHEDRQAAMKRRSDACCRQMLKVVIIKD